MSRTWNNDSFNIVEREKSEKGEKKINDIYVITLMNYRII